MTLGSLFDGSGGFPLAGKLCGITPVWASEIEPFPIAVTRERLPEMTHVGDVTKLDGTRLPFVDVITFGSPCQDMSIAGKRAGLKHEGNGDEETTRSGLFMEAVRIIREMREKSDGKYPRFAIWENVPGAFSSNKGADFGRVLQELVSIKERGADVPRPTGGKWTCAGRILGDDYSIAWRTLDAQYFGVPQRRRRIYLVADFAGQCAPEILFERESMPRDIKPCAAAREGIADDVAGSAAGSGGAGKVECLTPWDMQSSRIYSADGVYPTLDAMRGYRGQNHGVVFPTGGVSNSLCARHDSSPCVDRGQPFVVTKGHAAAFSGGQGAKARGIGYQENVAPTLKSVLSGGNTVPDVVYALQGNGIDRADTAGCNGCGWRKDEGYTLNTIDRHAVVYDTTQITSPTNRSNPQDGDACHALAAHQHPPLAVCVGNGQTNQIGMDERTGTLNCMHDQQAVVVTNDCRGNGSGRVVPTLTGDHQRRTTDYTAIVTFDRAAFNQGINAQYEFETKEGDGAVSTVVAKGPSGVCHEAKGPKKRRYIVRRLTPLECCRLQGFPDGWADIPTKTEMTNEELAFWFCRRLEWSLANGKPIKPMQPDALLKWYNKLKSDSAMYKMWGNGIALPCAQFVLEGVAEELRKAE